MNQPGELYNKHMSKKHKKSGLRPASAVIKSEQKASHQFYKKRKIKHTGKFAGKSNALGQGGRAAQLKAQGVPGGVIGNLARAAHAAPGQKNYHKKHKGKKKKAVPFISKASKSDMKKYPTPEKLGWGSGQGPLQKGTLNMKPGLGKSFFKKRKKKNDNDADDKKKGMKCKKNHKHHKGCM